MTNEQKNKIRDLLCMGFSNADIAMLLSLDKEEVRQFSHNFTNKARMERKTWIEEHGWNWQFKKGSNNDK